MPLYFLLLGCAGTGQLRKQWPLSSSRGQVMSDTAYSNHVMAGTTMAGDGTELGRLDG